MVEIFGVNPVLEALRANRRPIREITIADGVRDARLRELIELARVHRVPVNHAPRINLDRLTGHAKHQGVVARIAASHYAEVEDLLNSVTAGADTEQQALFVVLDGIEDPQNLGAVLRTAECAGVDGVFLPERRAAGLTEADCPDMRPQVRPAFAYLTEEMRGQVPPALLDHHAFIYRTHLPWPIPL